MHSPPCMQYVAEVGSRSLLFIKAILYAFTTAVSGGCPGFFELPKYLFVPPSGTGL